MELGVLFLLLPLAALSGWWIGRRQQSRRRARINFSGEYLRGLNYVLSEQPDKAIDVFVQMVEVDSETIETHFALGSLYRRRGETERAIRIHQNLVARPSLTDAERSQAVFELAKDYLAAGLLDRAETLFLELSKDPAYGIAAKQHLLEIYQQEREWQKAIDTAEPLRRKTGVPVEAMIAHFHCELAEVAFAAGDTREAFGHMATALSVDPRCVRASLLESRVAASVGDYRRAAEALKRVEVQDHELIPETVALARKVFLDSGREQEFVAFLHSLVDRFHCTNALLALAEREVAKGEPERAAAMISEFVERHPSLTAFARLLDLKAASSKEAGSELAALSAMLQRTQEARPKYRCRNCGFAGKQLFWECPGCKKWNTFKPIHIADGE